MVDTIIRDIMVEALGVPQSRVDAFTTDTPLFGSLPELDSMAVANLLTELEDRLGIFVEDDEVDGEMLESFGNLVKFAKAKVGS
jgi:acyl carrier protein